MRGEDHVVAAFQHTDLLQRGAGGPTEIRLGHDAEHDVARGFDVDYLRAQWPRATADADIEGQRAGHQADNAAAAVPAPATEIAASTARRANAGCAWLLVMSP